MSKPLTPKQEKFCHKCQETIAIGMFAKDLSKKDGLQRVCKKCNAEYRLANKDKRTKYLQDNKEKLSQQNKLYIQKNIDKRIAYKKQYRQENKEHIAKYNAEYMKTDKGKIHNRNNVRRRRSQIKDSDLTTSQIIELKTTTTKCYWCHSELNEKYHLDHYIPLSRGGKHTISNIVISCPSCNLSKQDKMPEEFARQIGRLL